MDPSQTPDESRPRFSENARWAMGYSHRLAVSRGCPTLTTMHLLAAIASHYDGDVLLKGSAAAIRKDVLGSMPPEEPIAIAGKDKHLPAEPALKTLIKAVTEAAWSAPAESPLRDIELTHYL